ncbi:aldo/keto reductase [Amycolatopsis lurida]|uniref:aldo/keto reductase n=1 Tax=Amycolatopsis lurida TaxID=31959 RepID=UPI00364CABA3
MRGIDTAYNYRGFTTHRALARTAADLLGEFTLSTKVGYFPGGSGERPVHSLDPARLRAAVERSASELDHRPDVVFLHNPELALSGLGPAESYDRLAAACAVLSEAAQSGLCGAWGVATWDPRPVVAAVEYDVSGIRPEVVLLRAGLSVAAPILNAGTSLCQRVGVASNHRWGMSPFAGNTADTAWAALDLRAFLAADQACSTPQAAFRLAYELPVVTRVAVGTSSPAHLRELVAATALTVSSAAIARYRELISAAS